MNVFLQELCLWPGSSVEAYELFLALNIFFNKPLLAHIYAAYREVKVVWLCVSVCYHTQTETKVLSCPYFSIPTHTTNLSLVNMYVLVKIQHSKMCHEFWSGSRFVIPPPKIETNIWTFVCSKNVSIIYFPFFAQAIYSTWPLRAGNHFIIPKPLHPFSHKS